MLCYHYLLDDYGGEFFSDFVGVCLFCVGVPSLECVPNFFVSDLSFFVLFHECGKFLLDFPLVSREDEFVVVEVFEAEEGDSSFEWYDFGFCRVEFDLERSEESCDSFLVCLKRSFLLVEYDEVVDVANVLFCFELVFYVLVEFVQVDVGEELARPVSERHAFAGRASRMVFKNDFDDPENVLVLDALSQDSDENVVVDGVEVVLDVGFECVARDVVLVLCLSSLFAVFRRLACELVESFDGVVRSFSFPAHVAVMDEAWFEDRLENVDKCVVHDSVSEVAFADDYRLRVSEDETL